jgi:hypothetical protein
MRFKEFGLTENWMDDTTGKYANLRPLVNPQELEE